MPKGFKRRVGIEQALIHDPDVLIFDEPTGGLGPNQKHDMWEPIRAMAPGKAIVVSTHILEEVDAVCGRGASSRPARSRRRAGGQQAVRLRVATTSPELAIERLRPVVGEARFEVVERASGAISLLLFGSGLAPDSLAGELVKADLAIEEIGVWRPRLEDVFRSITSPANDSAPAASPAPAGEKPAA